MKNITKIMFKTYQKHTQNMPKTYQKHDKNTTKNI